MAIMFSLSCSVLYYASLGRIYGDLWSPISLPNSAYIYKYNIINVIFPLGFLFFGMFVCFLFVFFSFPSKIIIPKKIG